MPLSREEKELLVTYLDNRGVGGCPFCGHREWGHAEIVAPQSMNSQGELHPTSVIPMVTLTCNNCSYVASFSAMRVGLLSGHSRYDSL